MPTQEPLYTTIAINGACRRQAAIILKPINSINEIDLNSLTKNTQKQPNHNSKPSEA